VNGEDPNLAGIKPGPQPLPEQWQYLKRDGLIQLIAALTGTYEYR